MRLRTARKIMSAADTPRESAYTNAQHAAANRRYERTASAKEADALWQEMMAEVRKSPALPRARDLVSMGLLGDAFRLLMESSQW